MYVTESQLMQAVLMVGVAGYVIYRQFATRTLTERALLMMPAIIAFIAVRAVPDMRLDQATIALASIGLVVGVVMGVARGAVTRVWMQGGQAQARGNWPLVALWVATLGLRLVLVGVAAVVGVDGKSDVAISLVVLACTLAAQNLVIWSRVARLQPEGLEAA